MQIEEVWNPEEESDYEEKLFYSIEENSFSKRSPSKNNAQQILLEEPAIYHKIELELRTKQAFLPTYLSFRSEILDYMQRVNYIIQLPLHCLEYSFRLIDKYLSLACVIPKQNSISLLCLTVMQMASKFITELDLDLQNLCDHFNLNCKQMELLELDILIKVDYELIIPTISDFYDTLYRCQPPQSIIEIAKSSELLHQQMLFLAISLRSIEAMGEAPTNETLRFLNQNTVEKAKTIVNALKLEMSGTLQLKL